MLRMKLLDIALHNRLERIREDLDSYIDVRLGGDKVKASGPIAGGIPEEINKDSAQKPMFSFMRLNQDASDHASYLEGADLSENRPSVNVQIPEFLRREERHRELDKMLEKKEESFSEMLLRMIDEKGLRDSDVYKRANIDRRLFSKIRGDENYVPSRKTAISFCLALHLGMDETKKLLATAGYTLSASSRFDLIIMYLIENGEYNIQFVNIVLDDYGVGTLSR